jgi:drug/metabolite transporter (DMT)-like permease
VAIEPTSVGHTQSCTFHRCGVEGLAIGYLAVASTAIAFVLWYRALARLGPERTGLFAGLMPVSAALVGAAVTAAPLRLGTLVGTIVTGIGLVLGLGSRRRARRNPPSRRLDVRIGG